MTEKSAISYFQIYSGTVMDGILLAAVVTEENIPDLCKITRGKPVTWVVEPDADEIGIGIKFSDGEVAGIGDYIVSDFASGFQPFDKEVFELHWRL